MKKKWKKWDKKNGILKYSVLGKNQQTELKKYLKIINQLNKTKKFQ